jgi:hypothetical protein
VQVSTCGGNAIAICYEYAENGFAALVEMLQFEGCRLARKHNITISEFKGRNGWLRSYFGRNSFTIRCQMMIAQRLPEAYEENVPVSRNIS